MLTRRRLARAVALLLPLAMACAASDAPTCPAGSALVGNYTLTYTLKTTTDACVATLADGGPSDAGVTGTPAPSLLSMCAAPVGDAGVELILGTNGSLLSQTDAGTGMFTISDTAVSISDTICACALDVAESVGFTPVTADGGPFRQEADGGYSTVTSVNGSVDYIFTASGTTNGLACACTLPCGAHYSLNAVP